MRAKTGWCWIVVIAGLFAVVIVRRFATLNALRADYAREKASAGALTGVRVEHERLLAARPGAGELERLTAEAAKLPQARAQIAKLRDQAEQTARAETQRAPSSEPPFAVGNVQPAAQWRNAGTATPQAALETALWAGAGGDVETFAKLLTLVDAGTKRAARALWEGVPEEMRLKYNSPERLIAFLTVRDVPLGSAQVQQFSPLDGWPVPAVLMRLLFRSADDKPKEASLAFANPGDGWKLVVTEGVVAKYAAMLKQPEAGNSGPTGLPRGPQ